MISWTRLLAPWKGEKEKSCLVYFKQNCLLGGIFRLKEGLFSLTIFNLKVRPIPSHSSVLCLWLIKIPQAELCSGPRTKIFLSREALTVVGGWGVTWPDTCLSLAPRLPQVPQASDRKVQEKDILSITPSSLLANHMFQGYWNRKINFCILKYKTLILKGQICSKEECGHKNTGRIWRSSWNQILFSTLVLWLSEGHY